MLESAYKTSYQQIGPGIAAATGLTVPAGCVAIEVVVSGQAVRWRADGTAPTAALGQPMAVGEKKIFTLATPALLQFIESAAGATLDVTYYTY